MNATIALGFDSVKLDGCGAEEDVELWAELFNHSLREKGGTGGGQPGIMIENCHNGQFLKGERGASSWPRRNKTSTYGTGGGYRLTNMPYFDKHNDLVCPYHVYRSSTDILPLYGSVLVNLNTIPALADARLSQPGCWAYPVRTTSYLTTTIFVNMFCGGHALCIMCIEYHVLLSTAGRLQSQIAGCLMHKRRICLKLA